MASAAMIFLVIGVTAFVLWKPTPPTQGDVIADLSLLKKDVIVCNRDGQEFKWNVAGDPRHTLSAGPYTVRFAEPAGKLRPFPDNLTVLAGQEVTVKFQAMGETQQ